MATRLKSFPRWLLAILVASVLSNIDAAPADAEDVYRVVDISIGDTLNVRAMPSHSSAIAGRIPAGATGIVGAGDCKAWCKIRYKDIEGWVDKRFLAVAPGIPQKAASQVSSDPTADCNSDDNLRKLRGCTALIGRKPSPPHQELSIAYSRRADANFATGELDAAISDGTKVVELEPLNANQKRRLSALYVQRAGLAKSADKGIADYVEAIKVDTSNDAAFAGRGILHASQGNIGAAVADLLEARKLQPDVPAHKLVLAKLYEDRGLESLKKEEWHKAIADLSEATVLDPANAQTLHWRGFAFAGKGDAEKAKRDYSEAIRLDPKAAGALTGRAEVRYSQKDYAGAIEDTTTALQVDGKNIDALLLRAFAREAIGLNADAVRDYENVLMIDLCHELARANAERVIANERALGGVGPPIPLNAALYSDGHKKGGTCTQAAQEPPTRAGDPRTRVAPDLAGFDTKQRVILLQQELRRVGCDPGDIDGLWGQNTEEALDEFSKYSAIVMRDKPFDEVFRTVFNKADRVCPEEAGNRDAENAPAQPGTAAQRRAAGEKKAKCWSGKEPSGFGRCW